MNYDKLSKIAILAFKNGLRLHFDSVLLFEHGSFQSALQLSILSMEEFGKYFSVSAFVFYTNFEEYEDEEELDYIIEQFLVDLYKHPFKQKAFFGRDGFLSSQKLWEYANQGNYEKLKQRTTYVGLPREKGKINLKGRVNDPKRISENVVRKNILFLNRLLIQTTQLHLKGVIYYDEEEVNSLLNRELLKELKNNLQILTPASTPIKQAGLSN